MRPKVFVVHPNPEARRHLQTTLASDDFHVQSSCHLSQLSGRHFSASPIDLLMIATGAAHSVTALVDWAKNTVHPSTRLLLIVEKSQRAQLQPWLGYNLDEYLQEPLDSLEVLTRVNACLTRAPVASRERVLVGPIEYDVTARTVLVNGMPLSLAPAEFRLITFLLKHPRRAFSRKELLRRAWSEHVKAGERTVDVHIRRLRQLLEKFHCDDMIETVRGFGYRFSDVKGPGLTTENRAPHTLTGAAIDR